MTGQEDPRGSRLSLSPEPIPGPVPGYVPRNPATPPPTQKLPTFRLNGWKTHINRSASTAYNKMLNPVKILFNKDVEAENEARRQKSRDFYAKKCNSAGSSLASLLTLDGEESRHEAAKTDARSNILNSNNTPPYSSPSLTALARHLKAKTGFFADVDPDEDEEVSLKDKRKKRASKIVEVEPRLSSAADLLHFHVEYDRLDNLEVYIGLHCFTNKALTMMHREGHLMKKEILWHNGKKHSVVDVNKMFGKEEDLLQLEWAYASSHYINFVRESCEGLAHRMQQHFEFWADHPDFTDNFKACLVTEIKMRQDYRLKPTIFRDTVYESQMLNAKALTLKWKMEEEMTNMRSHMDSLKRASNDDRGAGSSKKPRQSFQEGTGGQRTGPAVCLICGLSGHPFSSCSATKFADGSPLISRHDNNSLRIGGDCLCIKFNLSGQNDVCSQSQRERSRYFTHKCSFCGSFDHHAFLWLCRRPN